MTPDPGQSGWLEREGAPRLHYRAWPLQSPRATVLLVHGLGEHSGRYARLAADLRERGMATLALDLRGHGRSAGPRGHVARFAHLVDDVEALRVDAARRQPAGSPVFLLGHSLGGLVAARYLQTHPEAPLRGAILSAPALGVLVEPPAWKRALAGFCSRWLPALPFSNQIDPTWLTHDTEVAAALEVDPLAHPRITPRLYTEMLAAMYAAASDAERIRVSSLLLLLPGQDRIVDAAVARRWARGLPDSVEVEVREYPEHFHEVLNELERDAVVREMADWIEARIA